MNKLSLSMIQSAAQVAKENGAKAVMFDADSLSNNQDRDELIAQLEVPVLMVTRNRDSCQPPEIENCVVLGIPNVPLTRQGQIKIAVLIGVAEKRLERNDVLVCLSGLPQSDRLDMMAVIRVGDEPEYLLTDELNPVPPDVQPPVFEATLRIASELSVEGREKRKVGAIFVLGDHEKVLENSRQLVFNPFHGYPEEERNILTGELDETIKEFAAIDGAFVVRGDGVVLAAGRYLMPKGKAAESLRQGLGARHEAAAAITAVTDAVAITLSESTATITIFNSGRTLTEIEKVRLSAET